MADQACHLDLFAHREQLRSPVDQTPGPSPSQSGGSEHNRDHGYDRATPSSQQEYQWEAMKGDQLH